MEDTLYTKAYLEKEDDGYIAVASTEVEDRQGEVVEVDGWDLKNFKKNPILLLFHDHHSLPVGKAEKIWVEKSGAKKKMMFKPVFEDITDRGKAIKELVKQGFLKTFSVGFRPTESEGNRFTKQELLEISLVNVPANPEAMMLAYKSLKDVGVKNKTMQELGIPSAMIEKLNTIEARLEKAENDIEGAVNGLKYLNPHLGRNKGVVQERLAMNKVIAKATDLIMAGETTDKAHLIKVVKRANEILIVSQKGELNGKN